MGCNYTKHWSIYTLLLFIIYSNIFLSSKLLVLSKKNIIKLYLLYLFFYYHIFLIFFSKNYDFFMSFHWHQLLFLALV